MKPWSVSKIQTFEQCKMKYKFRYIDNVQIQEKNEALIKGSEVHDLLEHLDFSGNQVVQDFKNSKSFKALENDILNAQKEVPIGIKIMNNELVPCLYDDNPLFRGRVDGLHKNHIFDYKTGKAKSYEQQDWTQLEWYSIWFFLRYPEYSEVKISYIYVEHDQINSKIIKKSEIAEITKNFIKRIKYATEFDLKYSNSARCSRSGLCLYCPFMLRCESIEDF